MRPFLPLALLAACASDPADMAPPELGVSSTTSARMVRNRTVDVPIEIVRNEALEGPVTIEIAGLPPGVTAEPLEIADGETSGVLKLTSADTIALGSTVKAVLRATAGDVVATHELDLRLTDRPGSLDTTFATGGIASAHYSTIHDEVLSRMARQPDGKIVAAGSNLQLGVTMVTRFNADGSVDKDFSDGGSWPGPAANEEIVGLAVRPDGTIIVVGAGSTSVIRVLSSDGYPIETIALTADWLGYEPTITDMIAMPDGSFYLAGVSSDTAIVLRFGADLKPDPAFDGDGVALAEFGALTKVKSLMRRPDGRLVIAGYVQFEASVHPAAAQLNVDGSLDTSFTSNGTEIYSELTGVFSMADLLPDGRMAAVMYSQMGFAELTVEADGTIGPSQPLPMMHARNSVSVNDAVLLLGATVDYEKWNVTKFGAAGFETSFGDNGIMQATAPGGTVHVLSDAMPYDQDRAFAVGAAGPAMSASQSLIRIWL